MLRRRMPMPNAPSTKRPPSAGPRCPMAAFMRRSVSSLTGAPPGPRHTPTMPHISRCSCVRRSRVCLAEETIPLQRHGERRFAIEARRNADPREEEGVGGDPDDAGARRHRRAKSELLDDRRDTLVAVRIAAAAVRIREVADRDTDDRLEP